MFLERTAEHTRAFIKVQDGCNQFCSYCIIPFARGRVRSRNSEDVIREVKRLAEHGFREIEMCIRDRYMLHCLHPLLLLQKEIFFH